jgi:hypothetical protein
MRTLALWFGTAAMLGTGCPRPRGPAVPTPGEEAATSDAAGGPRPGGLPGLLEGPTDSDQAAAQLLAIEVQPGEAVVVLHCSFADGWASAVPLALADEIGEYLVQAVVALGSFQPIAADMPNRGRLAAYAAQPCSPDLVLHLAPGAYQLVVGRRDRLVAPLGEDAAWLDQAEVSAGDRLEYYVSAENVTLDVPCR